VSDAPKPEPTDPPDVPARMTVPDVPAEVVAILRARASARSVPLDDYVRELLVEVARTPTMAEVYQRSWPRPWDIDGEALAEVVRAAREEDE